MGIDDWSTDESQNLELDGSDISRRASPGAPANELTRKLMAHVKELEGKIVSDGVEVDGVSIINNSGTLTVVDVAIDGDTEDLLTEKIAEIEAAATQAGEDAEAAQTAATQAAASAASATSAITSASTAANLAAEQADIAARAAARAQSGAAMAESAVQAVISGTNLNWQKTEKAASVSCYPVPETVLEPAVDILFAETGPDSGTKGPDNPSTITGVSTITVTRCETVGVDSTDYVIDLGGSYYGGSLDVSTGVMTVTHYAFVLDGSEPFEERDHSTYYRYKLSRSVPAPVSTIAGNQACSHFVLENNTNTTSIHFVVVPGDSSLHFVTQQTTVSNFKSWIASEYQNGTPITVVYKLNTPTAIQLSPVQIHSLSQTDPYTPRINTIYTNASAVQVGYAKSPIRSEYELTQAIVATEGGE